MVPRVKICGITRLDDALAACEAGADALGFNFAVEAKGKGRYIAPEDAAKIIERLPPFVTIVAVCVNEPAERLREYLRFVDFVQLHGDETPEVSREVGHRAIKAFRAGPHFAVEGMSRYEGAAAFLLDAYVPGQSGGTGRTCDWDVARAAVHAATRPLILAGGLTPENVAESVRMVKPYGVDVSGGVESEPGKKDHDRIRDFIAHAKSALA